MHSYELIIERRQPHCGGKQPRLYDFLTVDTDDPEAYVRQREPGADLYILKKADGDLEIYVGEGNSQVKYVFSPQ